MSEPFMEMLFIDSGGDARQTGMGLAFETEAAARAEFDCYRAHEVEKPDATFLLDLHNEGGDLVDTILLDDTGFEIVTGSQRLSEADYQRIDKEYWDEARREYQQSKATP